MRAREMMVRLDRLPKRREGERKIPDFSLLSPERQDRVSELLGLIGASDDTQITVLYKEFAELVRDLPLIGPNDPEQGPLIEVPGELHCHWQWHQPPSKWPSLDFHKLTKVQTVQFNALCERYGFRRGGNPYKAQMPPMHTWQPKDRAEMQRLLDIAAS
jgi:hypothetical protein